MNLTYIVDDISLHSHMKLCKRKQWCFYYIISVILVLRQIPSWKHKICVLEMCLTEIILDLEILGTEN